MVSKNEDINVRPANLKCPTFAAIFEMCNPKNPTAMETKPPPWRRKRKQVLPEEITGILISLRPYAGTKNVSYYLEVPASGMSCNAPLSGEQSVRFLGYDHRYHRWYEASQWEDHQAIRYASGEYKYYKNGYLRVTLYTEHGKKNFYVHRLVALVCCPNDDPEHKDVTDHLDSNPQNNLPSNLEWVTSEENNHRRLVARGWNRLSDKKRERFRQQSARYSRAHRIRKQRLQESNLFE